MKEWETYEQTATSLLDRFADDLGLTRVEGKQDLAGTNGVIWEVDGRAIEDDDSIFLLVEVRRHTTRKLDQEAVAAFAYRIRDTGAAGGIIVSPLGLQEGAQRVANANRISRVYLDANATQDAYVMQFLNRAMVGVTESITLTETVEVVVRNKDGIVIDRTGDVPKDEDQP